MKKKGAYTSDYALRGRIGGYTTHARHDSRAITAKGRNTFLANFQKKVDPENQLCEEERLKRAEAALKAHMLNLSRKSAAARRNNRSKAENK